MALTESELVTTFTALCEKYLIKVLIDPSTFTINSPAAVDVEHDEQGNLVGIGVYDGKTSLYFTQFSTDQSDSNSLVYKLCRTDLIGHNGKGDFESLRQWGIPLRESQLIWDTFLIGHIIDSSLKTYGLKDMGNRELGITYPTYDDVVGKHKGKTKTAPKCNQTEPGCCGRRTLDKWPVPLVSMYNALDCFVTYKLYELQKDSVGRFNQGNFYFTSLEKPVSRAFGDMETRGLRIDVPYLKELKTKLEAQQAPIKASILKELGPINLNSPKQLIGALNAKEIYPVLKGKPSTDKRALQGHIEKRILKDLLVFSELDTLLSSFVTPYLERKTEVVHPFFNQCGTRTGRPSCSNPNLLQIPKRTDNGKLVRRMFIPRLGMFLGDCDFGQIEPRVMAHLSKDSVLCGMFNEDIDFHTFTSARLGISRDKAKVLNLSVGYRATWKSVMSQLGVSKDEAQKQIDAWWDLFPALRRWQEGLIYDSKRSGFCTTLLGRHIKVDGLDSNNSWKKEAAERQLLNNITQGSAAEIMKMAMIKIQAEMSNGAFQSMTKFGLLVQVYDELLFEADSRDIEQCTQMVKGYMEQAVKLDVPLTVDCHTGSNWAECR